MSNAQAVGDALVRRSAAEWDDLLERLPVNPAELDALLTLYDRYTAVRLLEFDDALTALLPELAQIFRTAMDTVFVSVGSDSQDDAKHRDKFEFLEATVSLCGRRGDRFLLDAVYSAARDAADNVVVPSKLASLAYRLCQACRGRLPLSPGQPDEQARGLPYSCFPDPPEMWIDFFSTLAIGQSDVSFLEWKDWANRTIPCVHHTLSTVYISFVFGSVSLCPPLPLQLPTAATGSRFPWNELSHKDDSIPLQLALMGLGGQWRPIFQSDQDGLSFLIFAAALTSFSGPTVILVETTRGERFGYFSYVPWKTSPQWFSGDDDDCESFLFRLHPSWNVYYPRFEGLPKKYHQFLNLPVSSGRKDILVGLAVGGVAPNVPRLHINPTLENCKASAFGAVFESGPLLASQDETFFDVDRLEVWAVRFVNDESFDGAVEAGGLRASIKESARQRCAVVDRTQFVNDFASGAFMNSIFEHRAQATGRADFVADADDEGFCLDGKE